MKKNFLVLSAWATLSLERIWRTFPLFLMALLCLLICTFLGIFLFLDIFAHIGVLLFFGGVLVILFFMERKDFTFPGLKTARYFLEASQKNGHNPITLLADRPIFTDEKSLYLWQKSQEKARKDVKQLKTIYPRAQYIYKDRWAMRYMLYLVLFLSIFYDGYNNFAGIKAAVPYKPANIMVDVWVYPPAYGDVPFKLLPGAKVPVLAGSTVKVKTHHHARHDAHYYSLTSIWQGQAKPFVCDGTCTATHTLHKEGVFKIKDGWFTFFKAYISLLPDMAPRVERAAPFTQTPEGVLTVPFSVFDDYGVAQVKAIFKGKTHTVEKELILTKIGVKEESSIAYVDLTTAPFAGLEVNFSLEATDVAGQKTTTPVEVLRLPERPFYHPLAKKLVKMRKDLLEERVAIFQIKGQLGDILANPNAVEGNIRAYLSLRLAFENTEEVQNIQRLAGFLWDGALQLEKGPLGFEVEGVLQAQKALQKALSEGRSATEVRALFNNLAQKLTSFLQKVQFGPSSQNIDKMDGGGRMGENFVPYLKNEDFAQLLGDIAHLLEIGAHEEAQNRLKELETLLSHLSFNKEQAFGAFKEQLQLLDAIINQQENLIDGSIKEKIQGNIKNNIPASLQKLIQNLTQMGIGVKPFQKAAKAMRLAEEIQNVKELTYFANKLQTQALVLLKEARRGLLEDLRTQAGYGAFKGFERDPSGKLHNSNNEDLLLEQKPYVRSKQIRDLLFERANTLQEDEKTHKYLQRLLKDF